LLPAGEEVNGRRRVGVSSGDLGAGPIMGELHTLWCHENRRVPPALGPGLPPSPSVGVLPGVPRPSNAVRGRAALTKRECSAFQFN
jgi:hypothetical protein